MKHISVRLLLFFGLVAACIFDPFSGFIGVQAWTAVVATLFAFAVIRFTGRAPIFVSIAIVLITAVVPFVILCAIELPGFGSWAASASRVAYVLNRYNTLRGFELLIPSAISIALMALFGRRAGPNISLKRTGLRPAA